MILDLLVVGAGPAGVSAALWARTLDLSVELIEAEPHAGGQLKRVLFHPANLAAVPEGDGPAIARVLGTQLAAQGIRVHFRNPAAALELGPASVSVRLADGRRMTSLAALVATGVRRLRLEVPGERELEGRGVSYSARRDRDAFAGQNVVVVGGGDGAYENAILLAEVGCQVTLVTREHPRARTEFRQRVAAEPRIQVHEGTRVLSFIGDQRLRAVRLENSDGEREVQAEGVVIKAGVTPNTEWCASSLTCDEQGFARVDAAGATSAPRVWAAGDVSRPSLPSLATAFGAGAAAAALIRAALRGR